MRLGRGVIAVIAATACAMTMTAAPAIAGDGDRGHGRPEPIKVIATGLAGPLQLADGGGNSLLVTQAFAGNITQVNLRNGAKTDIITGAFGASGASRIGNKIAFVTGTPGPEEAADSATARLVPSPPMAVPPDEASLYVAKSGQAPAKLGDLMAYELANNPDGQTQFSPEGVPYDALSNPFSVIPDRSRGGFALVADGGGNDVLRVNSRGQVSTFFVPPLVTSGECAARPNNGDDPFGCDPVATGLAYGPLNTVFLATLSGEAAGEGRVYILDGRGSKAKVLKVVKGFNSPTGVAVDNRGNMYVSELLNGQIVKVSWNGKRSYAAVTEPSAVFFKGGKLYSTAQTFTDGQIVQVNDSAFGKDPVPPPPPES
ncbi:MAG: ScyD/ScyE family protein [Nakamurella sp.]